MLTKLKDHQDSTPGSAESTYKAEAGPTKKSIPSLTFKSFVNDKTITLRWPKIHGMVKSESVQGLHEAER